MNNAGFSNFIEMGPSKVLQGLVKRTLSGVQFSGVDKAEELENILK
jgi:malonyl CoA-acyl carrier protein transacylase